MEFAYSDGTEIEQRIIDILRRSSQISSLDWIAFENYDEWAVRYHFTPERSLLLRHLNFSGLDVLELGCGMGGISRFLAEESNRLVMVDGSERRLTAARERVRDLKNWTTQCANIFDLEISEKFDVVTLIGVLEYSELFGPEKPFHTLLRKARSFLKPGGVLILAIENRLGLKYWSGSVEDHTGHLFDGTVGYPAGGPTPRTFSRQELLKLLKESGFAQVDEQYPFPDYKIPHCVLTRTLCEHHSTLASEVASIGNYQSYGSPQTFLFPNSLGIKSVASAGLMAEFANSFLFIASSDGEPNVRNKLMGNPDIMGWHYGISRKNPTVTTFSASSSGSPEVNKQPLLPAKMTFDSFVNHLEETKFVSGESFLGKLERYAHFVQWQQFLDEFVAFLNWSFERWTKPESATILDERAVDAILTNAKIDENGKFKLFDLEWSAREPVRKSWFILRNVLSLKREIFDGSAPFTSQKELYHMLCSRLSTPENLWADLGAELKLRQEVLMSPTETVEEIDFAISQPFAPKVYLRNPGEISYLRQIASDHESLKAEYERQQKILESPEYLRAKRLMDKIAGNRLLRGIYRRLLSRLI